MKTVMGGKNWILRFGKSIPHQGDVVAAPDCALPPSRSKSEGGNIFFALFAAVAMVGLVGFGFQQVLKGPITGMTDVTRRTVAESTVITASRLAIVGATTLQTAGGDCDDDGMIEPMPYRDAGAGLHPAGGGYLPAGLVPNSLDPWKTEYGYCTWDAGSVSVSDAHAGCGGATPRRLEGSPLGTQHAIAIVSAGKDRKFQTTCNAYVDTTPADSIPDTPLVVKTPGSDDIVLGYTYAEANDLGNGLWKPKTADPTTTTTDKNIEVTGSGEFSDKVVLTGNTATGGGLVLPGDPGNDSLTGACNAANDKQLRRNTSTVPPTLEICDFTGGLGWAAIAGGTSSGGTTGQMVARWKFDETTGQTANESINNLDATLDNTAGPAAWDSSGGAMSGALYFSGTANAGQVEGTASRSAIVEPTAVSVALWVKRDGVPAGRQTLMIKSHNDYAAPTYESYGLHISSAGPDIISFITGKASGAETLNSTAGSLPESTWVHVVGVYDPLGSAPQKRLYINGVLNASETRTDALVYDTTANGDLFFGSADDGGTESFNGFLDDARIYNYGLTASEVQDLYDNTSPRPLDMRIPVKHGKLFGWGRDNYDELGNGSTTSNVTIPRPVDDKTGFVQADLGEKAGCGLKISGVVYCWGDDTNGRLGNGATYGNATSPLYPVVNLENVVKVDVGLNHACALEKTGQVWCWGNEGTMGALGNNHTGSTSQIPVAVSGLDDAIDLSAGADYSCAIRIDGTAWCWGDGTGGQMGDGGTTASNPVPVKVTGVDGFVQIEAASATGANGQVCGVTNTGKAYCWGGESAGEFGNGAASGAQPTPQQVSNITDFVQISTNLDTTCGLRSNGLVYCWGDDTYGQLGNGATGALDVPSAVVNIDNFVKIGVGSIHSCGLRRNGEVWCWGSDAQGTIGNGDSVTANQTSPSLVSGALFFDLAAGVDNTLALADATALQSANIAHTKSKLSLQRDTACTIENDGTAWCWGLDSFGQLGNGATAGTQTSPSLVTDPGPWGQISVAGKYTDNTSHACAVRTNGKLYCWGSDSSGALGNGGGGVFFTSPSLVVDNGPWEEVSASQNHTCAIKMDGTLWCWGNDTSNNLGVSGAGNIDSPAQITDAGPWAKVSAGGYTNCAIKREGSLWCWGANSVGQAGDSSTVAKDIPTRVLEPGPWADVSVTNTATCAIKTNGSLWCWGTATSFGLSGNLLVPTFIDAGPWASVSANTLHTCGIKTDGSAWCWGDNTDGKLGDGTTTARTAPTPVVGGGTWTAIAAGGTYTCGMKTDGSVWCWGNDANGQLGNGAASSASISYPVKVSFQFRPNPWTWNDSGTYITPISGLHPTIGTVAWLSHDGGGSYGFNFQGSGRSRLVSTTTANNFIIDTTGGIYSPQLSMKAIGATGGTAPSTSLVSTWTFNASGADSTGSNTITMTGSPTYGTGKVSNAVTFDGSGQYGSASRSATLEPTSFTIAFWAKKVTVPSASTAYFVTKHDSTGTTTGYDTSYAVTMSGSNIDFLTGSSGGGHRLTSTSPVSAANTWFHVTATYDSSAPFAQKKLYINGVLDNTATSTAAIYYDTSASGQLFVAASTGGASKLDGVMDDMRLYSRALDSGEVSSLYASQSAEYITRSIGLDYLTGSMKFSRNNTTASAVIPSLNADLEIASNQNVGIGTTGVPAAKLDVNGAIRIGTASGSCSAANAGTIEYYSSAWRYCSGASGWKTFGSWAITPSEWSSKKRSVMANDTSTCNVLINGKGYCWGSSAFGQLGNNTTTPDTGTPSLVHTDSSATGWSDWLEISPGLYHTCGIRANGTAWCWGNNSFGSPLGINIDDGNSYTRPVQVHSSTSSTGWTDWTQISSGAYHTCGLRADGSAWCWGQVSAGKLGNNQSASNALRPVQVTDSAGTGTWSDWVQISAGAGTACGVRVNGTAWCWGESSQGALGNNQDTVDAVRPVQVTDDTGGGTWSDWVQVSIKGPGTYQHACGIRANGTAWCWGSAYKGALGNNQDTVDAVRPVQVLDNTGGGTWSDWGYIDVNWANTCGIRRNGTLWCWGWAGYGQTGDNQNTTDRLLPVQVHSSSSSTGWTNWESVSVGNNYVCGALTTGTLWCWGGNNYGMAGWGSVGGWNFRPTAVVNP